MAIRNHTWVMLVAALCSGAVGCLNGGTITRSDNVRLGTPCSAPTECGAGLECEVEHGAGTCRAHGGGFGSGDGAGPTGSACATNADCAAGLECELEHGVSFCKPHGGGTDDDAGGSSSSDGSRDASDERDASSGTGAAPAGGACARDADCAAGLECELEHGAGTCREHGGGGR